MIGSHTAKSINTDRARSEISAKCFLYLMCFSCCYEKCNMMRFPCWSFVFANGKQRPETKMTSSSRVCDERRACSRLCRVFAFREPFAAIVHWFFVVNFSCWVRCSFVHTWDSQKLCGYAVACSMLVETLYGWNMIAFHLHHRHTNTASHTWHWLVITQCERRKMKPRTTMIKNDSKIMKRSSRRVRAIQWATLNASARAIFQLISWCARILSLIIYSKLAVNLLISLRSILNIVMIAHISSMRCHISSSVHLNCGSMLALADHSPLHVRPIWLETCETCQKPIRLRLIVN